MNTERTATPQARPSFFYSIPMEIEIAQIIEQVITEQEKKGKGPAQCDLHDIIRTITPAITDEMRSLVKSGRYQGAITINKIPILRRKEN